MARPKANGGPDVTDELSQLREGLAAAETDLAVWLTRWEHYDRDNPDKFRMNIKRAKERVARRKAALTAKEQAPSHPYSSSRPPALGT